MLNGIDKPAVLLMGMIASIAFAVEKPTSLQKTCVTAECHTDYRQKPHVHGPVSLGECRSCHEPLDPNEHAWQFLRKGKDLCEYCHLEQTTKKVVHEPLMTGDCTQCHDPHGGSDSKLVKNLAPFVCYTCHKDVQKVAENSAYQHSVVYDIGGCML